MATKAIVGEKVGMTQVWDDENRVVPVTVLKVAPCADRAGQDDRARRLHRPAGHLRPQGRPQADQARGRPLRARPASSRARTWSSCASTTSTATRSARSSRSTCSTAGERVDVTAVSKGKGFAGVMKRHNFSGQKRQPRHPPRAPHARLDRRLRHPGSGVQGHADGRPHGRREGHHAEPRGRRRPTPSATCCS